MIKDSAGIKAEIRKSMAPPPGDPAARYLPCVDCGEPFWDWTEKWRRYCADCGADRQRARYKRMRSVGAA